MFSQPQIFRPELCPRSTYGWLVGSFRAINGDARQSDSEAEPMGTLPTGRTAAEPLLHVLMRTMVSSVAADGPDLTARQLAVFLKIYLEPEAEQTVRGLAVALNVSKPAITRALDRLEELVFARRETDKKDRRSVIARRTTNGSAYLRTRGGYISEASKQVKK
jgi:DNA-binding MarR family transcriptional regulator